jgi:TrmH family RNA methyltransferase
MLSRREDKQLRALRQRKAREAEGLFLAEGVRAVEDLLDSPLAVRWVVTAPSLEDPPRGRALREAVDRRGIARREVAEAELRAHAGTETPQGVLAVAEIPGHGLDDLRPVREPAVVLVLDAVQDPGNLGTLARTAEALGAAGLVALPGTVDAWNPKAVRAAMGSSFRLPVVEAGWDELEPWLRARGFRVLAAAGEGPPLGERPARAALVVGNEGAGVSEETRRRADALVGIPLRGRAESLNVGAAGAILLWELLR